MKKSTLITIGDILHNLDRSNKELFEILELMNLSEEEMSTIRDAIFVLSDKLERIKQSKLSEYIGLFPTIFFSPNDLEIITSSS